MNPKFKITNIVPMVAQGKVLAFYLWDSGETESHYFDLIGITFEQMLAKGFERQAWYEEREVILARLEAEARENTGEVVE